MKKSGLNARINPPKRNRIIVQIIALAHQRPDRVLGAFSLEHTPLTVGLIADYSWRARVAKVDFYYGQVLFSDYVARVDVLGVLVARVAVAACVWVGARDYGAQGACAATRAQLGVAPVVHFLVVY